LSPQVSSRIIWPESGLGLLAVRDDGFLGVTDNFIRGYLTGPQLELIPESCDTERELHAALLEDPWRPVPDEQIEQLEDPDVRENYQVILAYRDRLSAAGTVEGCYLSAFTEDTVTVPSMFLNHMTQLITEHLLADTDDPFMARAAELFFREQAINVHDGAVLAADIKTAAAMREKDLEKGELGKALTKSGIPLRSSNLDVMVPENADGYWDRSGNFDYALDLSFNRPGLDALCQFMERWVRHLLMSDVTISPMQEISDENWAWHTGLDTESSVLLNDLYDDRDVDNNRMARLVSLFKLEFRDASVLRSHMAGRPIYMGVAMDESGRLRFKPQNLLSNMPLASAPATRNLH
jgi:hypothetical protein